MKHEEYKELYYCEGCGRLFKYPSRIRNTEKYEQDDPDFYDICPHCGSTSIRDYDADYNELNSEQMIMKLSDLWLSIERGNHADIELYKPLYLAFLNRATELVNDQQAHLI